jgi:hypothetical protein
VASYKGGSTSLAPRAAAHVRNLSLAWTTWLYRATGSLRGFLALGIDLVLAREPRTVGIDRAYRPLCLARRRQRLLFVSRGRVFCRSSLVGHTPCVPTSFCVQTIGRPPTLGVSPARDVAHLTAKLDEAAGSRGAPLSFCSRSQSSGHVQRASCRRRTLRAGEPLQNCGNRPFLRLDFARFAHSFVNGPSTKRE